MKKPKRPKDSNQLAKLIVDIATGEADLLNKSANQPSNDKKKNSKKDKQ